MTRRKTAGAQNTLSLVPSPAETAVVRPLDIAALPDADLMSLAGGWTMRDGADAVSKAGGLKPLLRLDTSSLEADGLDYGRAAQVAAMAEIARRIARPGESRPTLKTPADIYDYLAPTLAGKSREEFWVLALNSRNVLIRAERVAQGSTTSCPVDPRDVFSVAVTHKASGIILAHNHPSGDPTPSGADIQLTNQLVKAADYLCVKVLDHLIIGDWNYASMASRGDLSGTLR